MNVLSARIGAGQLAALLTACGLHAGSIDAAPTSPDPDFRQVRTVGGIQEYVLESNGLTVLIKPDRSVPVVNFQVVYRVGSRHEVTGTTGATHLLEHLMFKGSDAHNRRKGTSIDQFLERVGAEYNATTWTDRTNYFATLGGGDLEGYVAIEADRMRNLWLRDEDKQAEMTVVRNEYERAENDPAQVLGMLVNAISFLAHPYHHETLGWRSDIENVPIGKLREFYDTYYWPDNATVTFVGDVEPAAALALVKKYYGRYPRAPKPIPALYTTEPVQQGARRAILKRPGELGVVAIAYKGMDARHADAAALQVLGGILSNGKNSRLYKALVDKGLALDAGGGMPALHDPGLFTVTAMLAPGVRHEMAEKALITELDRIKATGVTQAEIDTVVRQRRVSDAFGRDGVSGVAGSLCEWIAAGDWTLFVTNVDRMARVTPADVRRVAKQYLNEDQSSTGWFVPVVAQ